ncbi:NACHT, LRR and PYD domains-containing protein 12 isoform X2 [Hydra vulgaris]|uniref:NACHT, LRR and PYD domains-containing protein 12 isoform X2 n=1 Tax=Hydra vulgaris TaxID=6087 RepID=UPI001F5EDF42|nr:NACHT, LRR and PYD domains-containing protein 12 isoform X2 [Hydra vulgaris]
MTQNDIYFKKYKNILDCQEFKLKFSESVGVDWKTLGCWLNIEDNYLEIIDQDNVKTERKAYLMLNKWMQINKDPTLEVLKTALRDMKRMDLIRKIKEFSDSSNESVKLKKFYLENYGTINELQPPLKAPANVDLIHKFVDLCIVDAVSTQMDAVYGVEINDYLEKQMGYTPIPYNDIFIKEKSSILISGIAGIGKTWLLRKCLLDWSNDLIWRNIDLLFYFECRRINQYQNISNINELINVFYKDFLNEINISNHRVLFIIDGLDEFKYLNELINPSLSCSYPIVNALVEIKKYKYVIAGRVYAIDYYQSISTEHNKLTIQIMGFNENGINDYIENNVIEEKKELVKTTLKDSPIAKAMASVPFYLSSMCKIISDSTNRNKSSFLTMTDLYANIFLYFLQKHIIKNNELIYQIMENNSNKKYILNICKIAYQLFIKNKVIFSREEIQTLISDFDKDECNLFGFIERIETNLGYHYQFAHLTIMEFCASVYAYNSFSNKEIMNNKKLKSCLSMICGLNNKNENNLLKFLANLNPSNKSFFHKVYSKRKKTHTKKSLLGNLCIELPDDNEKLFIKCFYESQSMFTDEIKSFVNNKWLKVSIDDGKTSYQTSCAIYFVNHLINSGGKLMSLSVRKNNLSDEEKKLLVKCLTNVCEVYFYQPTKFDGWKPKDKLNCLTMFISNYLISKKDFEDNILPWFNLCEELVLDLHDNIDFIEDIHEWIRFSNIKDVSIKYCKKYYGLENIIKRKNLIS